MLFWVFADQILDQKFYCEDMQRYDALQAQKKYVIFVKKSSYFAHMLFQGHRMTVPLGFVTAHFEVCFVTHDALQIRGYEIVDCGFMVLNFKKKLLLNKKNSYLNMFALGLFWRVFSIME